LSKWETLSIKYPTVLDTEVILEDEENNNKNFMNLFLMGGFTPRQTFLH
jgi:hypothetical protein